MKQSELENLMYVALRFKPDYYGINLSADGWTSIDAFIYRINFLHGENILDRILLYQIVKKNPRFSINAFRTKIKANIVNDEVAATTMRKTLPPDKLWYVLQDGDNFSDKFVILPRKNEKYVVLKSRYPVQERPENILLIDARQMSAAGYAFYLLQNGDILTERVSGKFVRKQ